MKYADILSRFPVRVALTDDCNLDCFFCSNEGMDRRSRETHNAPYAELRYLLEVLSKAGLRQVSLTGGDPAIYPKIDNILDDLRQFHIPQVYLHTNGVGLSQDLIQKRRALVSKIGISLHATDYDTWRKLTRGSIKQYLRRDENISALRLAGYGKKVEIKHIPIRGINSSAQHIKSTLDLCAASAFRFKFLKLEPTTASQRKLVLDRREIEEIVSRHGGIRRNDVHEFRGQSEYIPVSAFRYLTTGGVVAEVNCGVEETCSHCSNTNEIFVTPDLRLKPCRISAYAIDLRPSIQSRNDRAVLDAVVSTRTFLSKRPGLELVHLSHR